MTMVPAQTLSIHHQLYCFGGYGASYPEEEKEEEEGFYETAAVLLGGGSGLVVVSAAHIPMADDESKTPTTITTNTTRVCLNNIGSEDDQEEAAASSGKAVGAEDDASWLQLSIGGSAKINTPPPPAAAAGEGVGLLKLDLVPPSRSEGKTVISQENKPIFHVPRQVPSFLFQAGVAGSASSTVAPPPHHHHKKINWEFRPTVFSVGTDSLSSLTSSSSNHPPSTFMQLGSYFARTTPFQLHGDGDVDFRVIDPPRRPNSGIWFSLQASQKQ